MSHKPKPCSEVFCTKVLSEYINSLPEGHKHKKWITDMKEVLEQDVLAGDRVEKRLIPREYIDEFGANHLYRYSHPEGYRSCYIIVEGCPRILDMMNHDEYSRKFGYSK